MARELPDWINGYLHFTQNSEPPTSYHYWAALSLIAGALQRKVHLKWGFETIYVNLFVVLVGHSGRTRKGVALGIAREMLIRIPGVSVAPEASSREAIILAMKRANASFQDDDGVIHMHCSLTAFSEELSVLLGQSDIKLLANLTDWQNSKDEWVYETVGRGRDELQGLCFNLLGATAPDWLQSMLPQEAVGGGFTSRVIFVVEEKKRATVPEHTLTSVETELQEMLFRDLQLISLLKGNFTFSQEGKDAYTSWYTKEDDLLNKGEQAVEDPRFAGYCERRATHLRKMMMLMSVSRGDSLVIELQDFKRALALLKATEVKMHKTFGGLGKAKYGDVTELVMNYIRSVGITTRSSLMAKFYRDLDSGTLRGIEEMMQQMKVIQVKSIPDKGEKVYTWIEQPKDSKH